MIPSPLSPIANLHNRWQTHLSFANRRREASLAHLDSFYYVEAAQGFQKRFYADIAKTRCAAQNNLFCRRLDATAERLRGPARPMHAPKPWRDAAALTGCFLGAVARQILDWGACVVGVIVGGWRSLEPYSPITMRDPKQLAPALQRTLGQHAPHDPLNIPYRNAEGDSLNVCQQFNTDAHRVNITIRHEPFTNDTGIARYSQELTKLCDGDALWTQHVSRMLTQEVGNSLLQTLLEGGLLHLHGSPLVLLDGDANQPSRPSFFATRVAVDSVAVTFSLTKSVRRMVVEEAEVYCAGSLALSATLQVPRPTQPATPAAPRVDRVDVAAKIFGFLREDLGD